MGPFAPHISQRKALSGALPGALPVFRALSGALSGALYGNPQKALRKHSPEHFQGFPKKHSCKWPAGSDCAIGKCDCDCDRYRCRFYRAIACFVGGEYGPDHLHVVPPGKRPRELLTICKVFFFRLCRVFGWVCFRCLLSLYLVYPFLVYYRARPAKCRARHLQGVSCISVYFKALLS